MKIYIHFKLLDKPWGGSNSFLSTLAGFFRRQSDVQLVSSIEDNPDILLMTSWTTGEQNTSVRWIRNVRHWGHPHLWNRLLKGARHPPKIVHRLDGIGYLYGRPDHSCDERAARLNRLSDHSIVQSRYSEALFRQEGFRLSPTTVIYNGVDTQIFNPQGRRPWRSDVPLTLGAASWSANPRKGHRTLAQASKLAGVRVRFIGNWPRDLHPEKVECLPAIPSSQLASFYRNCDAFLFPAENEACPNVLLEALSCGLPVIYHPSGGTPEIAARYGVALRSDDVPGTLNQFRLAYSELQERTQASAGEWSIEKAGAHYLSLFRSLL